MPKIIYLTHDSRSVRKAHNSGRNHIRNVIDYYQQLDQEKQQRVIDSITKSYAEQQKYGSPAVPMGGIPPPPPGFALPPGAPPPPFPGLAGVPPLASQYPMPIPGQHPGIIPPPPITPGMNAAAAPTFGNRTLYNPNPMRQPNNTGDYQ